MNNSSQIEFLKILDEKEPKAWAKFKKLPLELRKSILETSLQDKEQCTTKPRRSTINWILKEFHKENLTSPLYTPNFINLGVLFQKIPKDVQSEVFSLFRPFLTETLFENILLDAALFDNVSLMKKVLPVVKKEKPLLSAFHFAKGDALELLLKKIKNQEAINLRFTRALNQKETDVINRFIEKRKFLFKDASQFVVYLAKEDNMSLAEKLLDVSDLKKVIEKSKKHINKNGYASIKCIKNIEHLMFLVEGLLLKKNMTLKLSEIKEEKNQQEQQNIKKTKRM